MHLWTVKTVNKDPEITREEATEVTGLRPVAPMATNPSPTTPSTLTPREVALTKDSMGRRTSTIINLVAIDQDTMRRAVKVAAIDTTTTDKCPTSSWIDATRTLETEVTMEATEEVVTREAAEVVVVEDPREIMMVTKEEVMEEIEETTTTTAAEEEEAVTREEDLEAPSTRDPRSPASVPTPRRVNSKS